MNAFQEKIVERAYTLYVDRGRKPGHAMEDWIRAKKEIKEYYASHRHAERAPQNAKPQEALLFFG